MESEYTGNDAFMEMAVKKIEAQDERLLLLEGKLNNASKETGAFDEVKILLEEIKKAIEKIDFPEKKIMDLNKRLQLTTRLFEMPRQTKVIHQHHIQKGVWIISGLLIIISGLTGFLFSTINKLDQFRAADIKYRFVKLKSAPLIESYLFKIDSLYQSGYPMKDSVTQWESEIQDSLTLRRQLEENNTEAELLKKKEEQLFKKNVNRKR